MKAAKLVRQVQSDLPQSVAHLYELSEHVQGADYIVVTAYIDDRYGPAVDVSTSDEDGEKIEEGIMGSYPGGLSHARALEILGYEEELEQP